MAEIKTGTVLDDMPGGPPPTRRLLGWDILSVDEEKGRIRTSFTATEEFLNPAGFIQGGILAAMMDDAMGPIQYIMTKGERMPSTTDLHTQYFRPARPGKLICEAWIDHLGGRVGYTTAELRDEDGALIARAIQTAMLAPFGRE